MVSILSYLPVIDITVRAEAVTWVVHILSGMDDSTWQPRVYALAKTMEKDEEKVQILNAIAQSFAKWGNRVRAKEVARQALKVAMEINHEQPKSKALSLTAQTLCQLDDIDGLRLILYTAGEMRFGSQTLSLVTQALAKVGETSLLIQLLEEIGTSEVTAGVTRLQRAEVLAGLARAFVEVGEQQYALAAARQLVSVTEEFENPEWQAETLLIAAQIFAQVSDPGHAWEVTHQALETAIAIGNGQFKPSIEAAGQLSIVAAGRLEDDVYKARMLALVSQTFHNLGYDTEARTIARQAIDTLATVTSEESRVTALEEFVQILVLQRTFILVDCIALFGACDGRHRPHGSAAANRR